MRPIGSWEAAAALGAFHGLNPAMGWLFAVALGLQENRRTAVLAALAPIALGHAASVGIVGLLLAAAGFAVPPRGLRVAAAVALLAFGLFRLLRPFAHPRWVGMRVGFRDLVVWSFLMASAHGAGLMLAPIFLEVSPQTSSGHGHAGAGLGIVGVHTVTMLLVMGAVAMLIYSTLGLAILRRAWINIDLLWAAALVMVGMVMLWRA